METTTFDQLWALKPEEKGSVLVFDKETKTHQPRQIFRSYRTYLKAPPFDANVQKSYMYQDVQIGVPSVFLPFLRKAWLCDAQFNSMQVNWYEPEDYIQPHSDCAAFMPPDYSIGLIAVDEPGVSPRPIRFTNRETGEVTVVTPGQGDLYLMSKQRNELYRHEVRPGAGRRVSFTFRTIKD